MRNEHGNLYPIVLARTTKHVMRRARRAGKNMDWQLARSYAMGYAEAFKQEQKARNVQR
jgi:hypothetical protein